MSNITTYKICFLKPDTIPLPDGGIIYRVSLVFIGSMWDKNNIPQWVQRQDLNDILINGQVIASIEATSLETAYNNCKLAAKAGYQEQYSQVILIDMDQAIAAKAIKTKMKQAFGN